MHEISFIFPYRNRENHCKIIIPILYNKLIKESIKFEIIIIEQYDSLNFRRGNLLNEGAKIAKYPLLCFSDIDYVPNKNLVYYEGNSDIYFPVKYVDFVDKDLKLKNINNVPAGYRDFNSMMPNEEKINQFYGGVMVMRRDAFFQINGYNSLYKTWSSEDVDLLNRAKFYNLKIERTNRKENIFQALDHPDSFPGLDNVDFQHNLKIFNAWKSYLKFGVNSQRADIKEIPCPIEGIQVDNWIQCSNFKE